MTDTHSTVQSLLFDVPRYIGSHTSSKENSIVQGLMDYSKGKQKQPEGLVQILRQRKREETMTSMLERVRTTQDAMERIHWEEKMEAYPEHKRREQMQRSGHGVKESMAGYDEPREGPKFLRCSISEVVNEIKSEQAIKQRHLEEKKELARRKMKEQETMELQERDSHNNKVRKPTYVVRSIDTLGVDEPQTCIVKQDTTRVKEKATTMPKEEIPVVSRTKTNIDHVISQACHVLSNSTI